MSPTLPTYLKTLDSIADLTPHHIGVATKSIESELNIFTALGFEFEGEFIDEAQGIRGVFLILKNNKPTPDTNTHNEPLYRLELLENLPSSSRLDNYLKSHHKLYHIAFVTSDIDKNTQAILNFNFTRNKEFNGGGGKVKKNNTQTQSQSKIQKARMLVPIMNASYFKKLCFIMLPNRLLIELVELK